MVDLSKENRIIIFSAASGSGKTTLIRQLMSQIPQLKFSVSYTTRNPRPNEVHGSDYYFITKEMFQEKIQHNDFLEYARVHDYYYGTSKSEVNQILQSGYICVLDIDVQGFLIVRTLLRKATSIFILPPSLEELEKRLKGRSTETPEALALRLENAKKELSFQHEYGHRVINDSLDLAFQQIQSILAPLLQK